MSAVSMPGLPTADGDPVFGQPWEAEAFAMAVVLHGRGVFTWPQFSRALADRIAGDPTGAVTYYEHWLDALEGLLLEARVTDPAELAARADAWLDAAEHTPHGRPILLFGSRER